MAVLNNATQGPANNVAGMIVDFIAKKVGAGNPSNRTCGKG